ncbi:MAG: putative transglutaminase-like cysteine proteinase [Hyphomicrobiaceae bacterium]|jgi:predicted transglutaminase-like cysteine proteinase
MSFLRFTTLLACVLVFGGGITPSQAASAQQSSFMRVHGQALPPFGFVHFCQRYKTDCNRVDDVSFARFDANVNHLHELDLVNRSINTKIKPVTDMELYGREEFWTYPTTQGDCEDYVVLKRRILMSRGWPSSALLITVVRDENGDGHAVLTVRTKQGDYVLDNKVDDVRLWSQTPYKYLMRQSYLNPKLWMALDPRIKHGNGSVATTD